MRLAGSPGHCSLESGPSSSRGTREPAPSNASSESSIGHLRPTDKLGGHTEAWYAYGDLSPFTDEAADRRGLEGDLNKDPTQGVYRDWFTPMHLRIERIGDQKATAEVTLSSS
jgi:hypothetical protein